MIGKTISHYRIIEELGAGGMGKVFKAEDLKLGRTVALKFISENLARNEQVLKRFEREAQAASSLNHPNICTIYQFDEFDGKPFIVMELLDGEPLSELVRQAPLGLGELLEFAIQIADALQSAHEKGIIHRDIKPSNIFVSRRGIVKILDFGLAKQTPLLLPSASGDAATESIVTLAQSLSQPGVLVGTVEFMAPEQVRGESTDARADLFSLGVTLYVMGTGQSPFRGSSAAVILGAILHEVPTAPSAHTRSLPREFDTIVAKALEKDKKARYQTASELHSDLTRLKHRSERGGQAAQRHLRIWGIAAVVLLFSCLAILIMRVDRRSPHAVAPAQEAVHPQRRSLAVFGFKNLTGRRDIDWLSVALSEMLSTELAAGEALRIIPGENVTLAKVGFSLADADSYSQGTLAQLKRRLGTDLVVLGSYVELGSESGKQLRVDVRLQDTGRGETLLAISQAGAESDLFQLVTRIGAILREKLGAGQVPAFDVNGVRASLPSRPDVMRLYAEGLNSLRVFDFLAARDLLAKVVSAQPDYAPGHSALAQSYAALGYDEKAAGEAKRAFELSAGLSREDRLAIEARYRETTRDWEKAAQIYQSLWKSFPDNVDYGLQLAHAQTKAGSSRNALTTMKALRALPRPSRDDPRIDLAEASAHESLGDFNEVLQSLQAILARQGESRLILARAYQMEGWALHRTGKSQQALEALKQSQQLFSDSGQTQAIARVMEATGNIFYNAGDFARARQLHEQALAVFRKIGDQYGTANALNDIANTFYTKGDFAKAKPLYQESLDILRAVGSASGVAGALGNLANVLDTEGDLDEAGRMQEQSLAAFRQVGDQRGASATLTNIGTLLLEKGDLAAARKALEQALTESRKINFKSGVGYCLQGLGNVLLAQGDLAGARQNLAESATLRRDLGEQETLANVSVDLADLSIHEGKAQTAEQLARAAILEFQKVKDPESEAVAASVLTRALLAQAKASEAQAVGNRARSIIPRSATFPSQFQVRIASARVRAATGESRQAKQDANDVLDTAKRHGYLGYEFEARLALGEIAIKSGERAAGTSILEDLEKDAGSKGFLLTAREARLAL